MQARQGSVSAGQVESRISCGEFCFPAVPGRHERMGIVKLLGFDLVDVGLFLSDGASLVADPESVIAALRTSLREYELGCDDLFFTVGSTVEEIAPNQRDSGRRLESRREFAAAALVAAELGIRGITVLPGVSWAESPETAWAVCVEELGWRLDQALRLGLQLRCEPHVGSIAPVPELVTRLCREVPGLGLTLDVSHFDAQAVTLDRTLALVPLARHVHVRASMPGAVQVRWRDNETDFAAITAALDQAGYDGVFCIEYVPMAKWRCDEMDVVSESLAARAALHELGLR